MVTTVNVTMQIIVSPKNTKEIAYSYLYSVKWAKVDAYLSCAVNAMLSIAS